MKESEGLAEPVFWWVPNPTWSKTASRCWWNLKQRLYTGHSSGLNVLQTQDRLRWKVTPLAERIEGGSVEKGFICPFSVLLAATGGMSYPQTQLSSALSTSSFRRAHSNSSSRSSKKSCSLNFHPFLQPFMESPPCSKHWAGLWEIHTLINRTEIFALMKFTL